MRKLLYEEKVMGYTSPEERKENIKLKEQKGYYLKDKYIDNEQEHFKYIAVFTTKKTKENKKILLK